MSTLTIRELLNKATKQLTTVSDEARIEAEVLLARVANLSITMLLVEANQVLNATTQHAFNETVQRRLEGEPVAYITGEKPFYDIDLSVNPSVLIPRADTELLVELALAQSAPDAVHQILDLGTGSGAIALSMAKHRPLCRVFAVELSESACKVAESNAKRLQLNNVTIRQGSWFEPVANTRFDLIVSNPPYVDRKDSHLRQGDLRFEPQSALVAADNGLACYKQIIEGAGNHLNAGAMLMFEHGFDQAQAVTELLIAQGYTAVTTHKDLSGHDRVTMGRYHG